MRPPSSAGASRATRSRSCSRESHLAEVADPAGGSWYVERFTDQLADAAWAWFQEIEAAGGLLAAAGDGLVAERLAATRAGPAATTSTPAGRRSPG